MALGGRFRDAWRRPACYRASAEARLVTRHGELYKARGGKEFCVHYEKHANEHVCEYSILALAFSGYEIKGPLRETMSTSIRICLRRYIPTQMSSAWADSLEGAPSISVRYAPVPRS